MWSWGVIWPLLLIGFGVYIAWVWRRIAVWLRRAREKISKKLEWLTDIVSGEGIVEF